VPAFLANASSRCSLVYTFLGLYVLKLGSIAQELVSTIVSQRIGFWDVLGHKGVHCAW
jgi:hypothetical protein